jgi:hypothetical protein
MHRFLLFGFLGTAAAAAAAPQLASLEGQIADPLGAAVADVAVSLTPQAAFQQG